MNNLNRSNQYSAKPFYLWNTILHDLFVLIFVYSFVLIKPEKQIDICAWYSVKNLRLYTFFWAENNSPLEVLSLLKLFFILNLGRIFFTLKVSLFPLEDFFDFLVLRLSSCSWSAIISCSDLFKLSLNSWVIVRFLVRDCYLIFNLWKVMDEVKNRLILDGGNVLKSRKQSSVWAVRSSSGRHHWRLSGRHLKWREKRWRRLR